MILNRPVHLSPLCGGGNSMLPPRSGGGNSEPQRLDSMRRLVRASAAAGRSLQGRQDSGAGGNNVRVRAITCVHDPRATFQGRGRHHVTNSPTLNRSSR